MINEKDLKAELKRYPLFIKAALKNKDYEEVLRLKEQMNTIEWILNE